MENTRRATNKFNLKLPESSDTSDDDEKNLIESPKMDSISNEKFYGRNLYGGIVDSQNGTLNTAKEAEKNEKIYNLRTGAIMRAKREPEGSIW